MIGATTPLNELRAHFLATSSPSMPLAGMILWAAFAIASYVIPDTLPVWTIFVVAAGAFPLALLLDKLRGFHGISTDSNANPVVQLFMRMIFLIALIVPFVIIAGIRASDSDLVVLGMAILAGVIWIPYGWGADDKVGLIHAVVRSVGAYAAFLFAPRGLKAPAIAAVVALCYAYSLAFMKKPGSAT